MYCEVFLDSLLLISIVYLIRQQIHFLPFILKTSNQKTWNNNNFLKQVERTAKNMNQSSSVFFRYKR